MAGDAKACFSHPADCPTLIPTFNRNKPQQVILKHVFPCAPFLFVNSTCVPLVNSFASPTLLVFFCFFVLFRESTRLQGSSWGRRCVFLQLSIVTSNPIYFSYNVSKTLVLKPYIQLNVIHHSTADINGVLLSISFLCVQVSVLGYSREASQLCPGLHSTGCITNGQTHKQPRCFGTTSYSEDCQSVYDLRKFWFWAR